METNINPLYTRDEGSILLRGDNTNAFIRTNLNPFNPSPYKGSTLHVFIPNKETIQKLTVYYSNDTGFSAFGFYVFQNYMLKDGFNELHFSYDQLSITGPFNKEAEITTIQIRIDVTPGMVGEAYLDKLEQVSSDKGNIIFTMDDQWDTQYTEAFRILSQYGFKGNIAVIPTKVDQLNYMTLPQLKEVYEAGWDLINHTYNHPDLSTLTKEEQRTELVDTRNWLNTNGFDRGSDFVIYPYGGYNSDTFNVMEEEGMKYGRSLITGLESNPSLSLYETRGYNLTPNITVDQAKVMIDAAIATGTTLQFINHRYADTDDPMFYSINKYQEIVDYVYQKRNELNVITISELIKKFNNI